MAGTAALLAVIAVLALALGAILRHGAAAVTVLIVADRAALSVLAVALPVLPASAADWLLRVTPAAGFAIQQTVPRYPQVAASYTPAERLLPAGRRGPASPCCAPGPRSPWAWPPSCCAGGTHEARPLHAEWTKLRTSPGTGWLLLGVVALTVGRASWPCRDGEMPGRGLPPRSDPDQPDRRSTSARRSSPSWPCW